MKMNIIFTIIFLSIFALSLILFIKFRSGTSEKNINLLYKLIGKRFDGNSLKNISFSLLSAIVLSLIGALYTISLSISGQETVTSITRPQPGEGDSTLSLIADSDLYTGTVVIPVKDKEYTFEEASQLFSRYRRELDSCLLGDNESFLKVTTPLTFISSIGEEGISISWYISSPDIIDYSGNPVLENISPEGSELEIIATLSLGDNIAEICYDIVVYPEPQTYEDILVSQLSELINSPAGISQDKIALPTEFDGQPIVFYKDKSALPSRDISLCHWSCSPAYCFA